MTKPEVKITALDHWAVEVDGEPVWGKATVLRDLVHALVLAPEPVAEAVLYRHLDFTLGDYKDGRSFNQHVYNVRGRGLVVDRSDGLSIRGGRAVLNVDLWEFFRLVDEGPQRFSEARDKIAGGRLPVCADPNDYEHPIWGATLLRFAEAKAKLLSGPGRRRTASGVELTVNAMRQALLRQDTVSDVEALGSVRESRGAVGELPFPWHDREGPGDPDRPIGDVLADALEHEGSDEAARVVVTGGPGSGKTLAAISTYLTLAERFEHRDAPTLVPLYFRGDLEGLHDDFGTDAWLERTLKDAGLVAGHVPVIVISHADVFLDRHAAELNAVMSWKLMRSTNVLLCIGQSFYTRHLRHRGLAARVITLEPWPRALQERFVAAISPDALEPFTAWLRGDPAREELCRVPLHLVHAVTLARTPAKLAGISTLSELFEAVARFRLRVTSRTYDREERIGALGAVAYRFYRDAAPGTPIAFTRQDLRVFLQERGDGEADARARADDLEHDTLLSTDEDATRDELAFEYPSWGWFFVARYVTETVSQRPQEALAAFSKFLWPEIGTFCTELLADAYDRNPEQVLGALRAAFRTDAADVDIDAEVRYGRLARQQLAYFLGAIGCDEVRDELAPLVDPQSERYVRDVWVRRGVVSGLADGGDVAAADAYVDLLRAERDAGESAERDANIGFLLTLHGGQPFQPREPDAISDDPHCAQTVGELVRGLSEPRHIGSWRIKLFALLDLQGHPRIAPEQLRAALRTNAGALHAIQTRLTNDPARRHWPELRELSNLIARMTFGDDWKRSKRADTTFVTDLRSTEAGEPA